MIRLSWVVLVCLMCGEAVADVTKFAGAVEAEVNGELVTFTALSLDYDVEIRGGLVNVRVTQEFSNPLTQPVQARYLFPMHRTAAVHAMSMRVGNEVIEAEIQEKRKAEQTFAAAQQAGKAASLLTQQRPNMFTQKIANLVPGIPITVVIEYTHAVPVKDGAYELVVPMIVGPRFQPPGSGVTPPQSDMEADSFGVWELEALPAYPTTAGVHVPEEVVSERVRLTLELESATPLTAVYSDTHDLDIRHVSSTQVEMTFADGRVRDNRDFVLRYMSASKQAATGVLSHWDDSEGGYFSLLIEPPAQVDQASVLKREMVFLLDCSGSMSGLPMQASKAFMTAALKSLRPTDTFRIIRFSDAASEFSTQPLLATPANIASGARYTASLHGGGGTMMSSGIKQALAGPVNSDRVKNVVFLTDGYIGNEVSILRLLEQQRGDARLFAFGVGTGVNRYLMEELARVGHGFARYFDPTKDEETVDEVVDELVSKLQSPVLTALEIDWGDLPVTDVLPQKLPDLYMGDSIRVVGRYTQSQDGEISIRGRSAGAKAVLRRSVSLDQTSERGVLRQIWGREAVADLNQQFIVPAHERADQVSDEQLQSAITQLGLNFNLVTRWTAFVAVSRQVYNEAVDPGAELDVALPKVKGLTAKAYNTGNIGHAAPEPGIWFSLLLVALVVGGMQLVKRRTSTFG